MKISELSPDLRASPHVDSEALNPLPLLLEELETLVADAESLSSSDPSSAEALAAALRRSLARLSSSSSSSSSSAAPLPEHAKLQIWKLSFRLWNACVDLSNSSAVRRPGGVSGGEDRRSRTDQAQVRQAAAELLLLAGCPSGVPSAAAKAASFFHRTGLIWHELGRLDLAAACFERATDLVSGGGGGGAAAGEEERGLVLEINLARARTAWEASDRGLAVALLNRSKSLIHGSSPTWFKTLAEEYLRFGRHELSKKPSGGAPDASDLFSEALDLCEKGIAAAPSETLDLEGLKERCLRFMAAERLQAEDYEGVLRCVRVLRAAAGKGKGKGKGKGEHPSVGYVAMRAWLGAGRVGEAERELKGLVANEEAPEGVCVSAAEAYLATAGPEAALGVLVALAGRCSAGAGAALRIVKRVAEGGGGLGRARVVADLSSDERVVALFDSAAATSKERGAMHALLWNCGAEHFRSKDYEMSAELFESSMLYVPRDEENRSRRSNCFRVLCLCHLALSHLDRAREFIDEANKLEPNIKCAFLKFKIHLQRKEEKEAINQMQSMVSCVDFNPEFLTLSAHEAIASHCIPVAVASLSVLLNLYSPGKPMPMPEVAVLRNLITLLQRNPETELEVLKYSRRASARMAELGPESFFGKGAVGNRELSWFAGNSWNMGLRTGKEKKLECCSEFLELAAEFYNTTTDDNGNQSMVCKSLILSVGATLNVEEQKNAPLLEQDVKKAIDMLTRAGKLLPSLSSSSSHIGDQSAENSAFSFLHTYYSYQLCSRIDHVDSHTQQLQLIKTFAATKPCLPRHLLHLGLAASQGARPNPEAAEFSLNAALSAFLASPSPEYQSIGIALRKLACLAGYSDGNDRAYDVYRQAYQIIVGLKDGEYPIEEGKWLAMTAWNKAGFAVRLRQVNVARKWMKMGLDLARHLKGMEQYIAGMEECFASFEKQCGNEDGKVEGTEIGSKSQPVLV
ncbi:TPR repeat-containing protein ZIP4 [Ananas comosus]|uniref:Protein ZIP4 homolog n=1 Tax=Ananas comosus TaxID=4615 RepID=A0A6P5G3G0_ANACO|nr:TPR repeat-containing protein ZIP4 [Ananas comosus]